MPVGTLLQINGTRIPKLKSYRVAFNKLWKDSDRNMAGELRSTIIGIFPKIECEMAPGLTEDEVQTLINLLNQPALNVTYWNPRTKTTRTAKFYANDLPIPLLSRNRSLYDGVKFNLIAYSKE